MLGSRDPGRLTIIALQGTTSTQRELGRDSGGRSVFLWQDQLPGGTFSWIPMYSHWRMDDVLGKPFLADLDLDPELAADRVVTRFYEKGRFVDPDYVLNVVGTHPRAVFLELKNHPAVARFTWLDQDVEFGQPPTLVEEGRNDTKEAPGRFLSPEGSPGRGLQDPRDQDARSRGDRRGGDGSQGGQEQGRPRGGGFDEEVGPTGGVHPLAPTAQVSEQLPSAGKFTEGTAREAPKSTAIVRDLQKVLHEALEGVKVAASARSREISCQALTLARRAASSARPVRPHPRESRKRGLP